LHQPSTPVGDGYDRRPDVRPPDPYGVLREGTRIPQLSKRTTGEGRRALAALRPDRVTERLPQLHDRFIELAGTGFRQDRPEGCVQSGADGRGAHVPAL